MAWVGASLGALLALLLTAPAAWLTAALGSWTGGRLLALEASGTVWSGKAQLALGAGPGSRDQLALPQRLSWQLRPSLSAGALPGMVLSLQHPTLLMQPLELQVKFASGAVEIALRQPSGIGPVKAQMPVAWLVGLGAPWNTLQPSGELAIEVDRLVCGLRLSGSPAIEAAMRVQMRQIASRVSTLPVLGHYELDIRGSNELTARLSSRSGSALWLEGVGVWKPGGPSGFRGEARAAAGREEALSNLLNIIGRREGPRSLIALGAPLALGEPTAAMK
jgi:general secretion pathway protein N